MNKKIVTLLVLLAAAVIAYILVQSMRNPDDANQTTNNQAQIQPENNDSKEENTTSPSDENFETWIQSNNWILESVTVEKKKSNMNVNVSAPLTLQFDKAQNKVSGFSGCNYFSGSYETKGMYGLSFGPLASTKKACADPKANELENTILEAMSKVTDSGIKGEQLVLQSTDGYTQLLYSPAK